MDDVLIWILVSVALSIFGAFKKDKKKAPLPPFAGPETDTDNEEEPFPAWPYPQKEETPDYRDFVPEAVIIASAPVEEGGGGYQNPIKIYSEQIAEWEKKYSEPGYNFFEEGMESISSSAIGDAKINEDEGFGTDMRNLLNEFQLSRAVVFSEILNPKFNKIQVL